MKKYQDWRKAWNLGRKEAVVFLVMIGLAACYVMEFIMTLILKSN